MNIKLIIDAFKSIFSDTQEDNEYKSKDISRSLVASYTRGNVNLQLGRFSSVESIDRRREVICDYNFTD